MSLQDILNRANAAAAVSVDMNEVEKGGGGGKLLPEGQVFGVIIGYTDLGEQPQDFNGKPTGRVSPEFKYTLALFGEGVQNDDGSPYIHSPYPLKISRNERSGARALFQALNWKNDPTKTHFAQFIGCPFFFFVEHKPRKDDPSKMRSVINWKKTTRAATTDPLTRVSTEYACPPIDEKLFHAFLWDYPTLESWGALYQEGVWDDGTSKNRDQETILSATNFEGSPLHQLLVANNVPFTIPEKKPQAAPAPAIPSAPAAAAQVPQAAVPTPPVSAPAPAVPTAPAPAPAQQVAAPLAQPTPAVTAPPLASPAPVAAPAATVAVTHAHVAQPQVPASPAVVPSVPVSTGAVPSAIPSPSEGA